MTRRLFENKKAVYAVAAVVAVAVSVLFMLIFSAFIYFFDIDRGYMPFISTVCVAAGCFAGSYFAARKLCEKGYIIGLVIGGVCFILITAVSLIKGGGVTLNTLFHFVIIMLASVIGGISGVNRGDKRII